MHVDFHDFNLNVVVVVDGKYMPNNSQIRLYLSLIKYKNVCKKRKHKLINVLVFKADIIAPSS